MHFNKNLGGVPYWETVIFIEMLMSEMEA